MDELLKQWHAIITEGFANPSPSRVQRLENINQRIAAQEAKETQQREAECQARRERIKAAKARIAFLEETRVARIEEIKAQIGLRV